MVTVPHFCPDVPCLKENPIFLYYPDHFEKPNPFAPDVAVAIDSVIEKKLDALDQLESQLYEGGANRSPDLMPGDPDQQQERRPQIRHAFPNPCKLHASRYPIKLTDLYGSEKAASRK